MRVLRTTRLAVAGVFLLLIAALVFSQQAFDLNPFFEPTNSTQIVLLSSLSAILFLFLMVFLFVLLREVVKVWVER
jgi:hypothetical protein